VKETTGCGFKTLEGIKHNVLFQHITQKLAIETRKCRLAFCLSCCFHWNSVISISTDFSEIAGQISGCISIDESSTRSRLSLIAFMSSYT